MNILKTYNFNLSRPLTILKSTLGKLKIKSILTIFLFFIHQSVLFAQNSKPESGFDTYSQFLIVTLIILVASIFIGLEKFDDPKYVYKYSIQGNAVSDSIKIPEYYFEKNVTTKLKIAVYITGLLLVMYAALVLLI